ncbi:MAG: isocitrate dehydrogenase (NADP(+)) [Thermotogae bacterium]|nr:isocitrate dehydrogenase (NADP(+)) [Thermotogota bacterium]
MNGEKIRIENGKLVVPDTPIIPYIEGDGTGPEIMAAVRKVLDAAVEKAYGGKRRIVWKELLAGEKAIKELGEPLPKETVEAIREHYVAIKGPLTTPVGGGYRSLNVALRQLLDLYANVRPAKYYPGVPSPLKHPERVNMVVFRENTEDVYAGIEWKMGTPECEKVRRFLNEEMGTNIPEDAGIGVKPISKFRSQRLVRKAIEYALEHGYPVLTLMHKGNIMKYTEGAFRDWGYELLRNEYAQHVVFEGEGERQPGKVLVNDRIADNMFQQILTRPNEYGVIATTNLNGDYISDALAALVGGLGMAPGANVGDHHALFEPVHGSAPKYAGKNMINPTAGILAGMLMLEHIGWKEAAKLIDSAVAKTISERKVTYDLARHIGVEPLSTTEYTEALIDNL